MCYLQSRLIQRRRRVPRARTIWDAARLQSSSDDSDGLSFFFLLFLLFLVFLFLLSLLFLFSF